MFFSSQPVKHFDDVNVHRATFYATTAADATGSAVFRYKTTLFVIEPVLDAAGVFLPEILATRD
jgi:hypothetical protein